MPEKKPKSQKKTDVGPHSESGAAPKPLKDLRRELRVLQEQNRELAETLDAIRSGEVDAIVIPDGENRKIYTLEGPDHPYRALVENIREGALTLARDGTILYANSRFAEMVKIPVDKVPGRSLLDYVCPEDQAGVTLGMENILNQPWRNRVRLHQKKGLIPVLISMNPLSDTMETKISVVVTDRRQDEEQIRFQARMLDSVADAVVAADPAGKIVYWNDAATKIYGWGPEEAIGKDLVGVIIPAPSAREYQKIFAALKKGATWRGEYTVKHRNGYNFPTYASDSPVFDEDGNLIAVVRASYDITDQKVAEENLRQKNDELVAMAEELKVNNEELSAISEELRQTNDSLLANDAALRKNEAKLSEVLASIPDDFYVLDYDWKFVYANRQFTEKIGKEPEDFIGKCIWEMFPKHLGTTYEVNVRDAMENRVVRQFEIGGLYTHSWYSMRVIPSVDGITLLGTDITDRKQAEDKLKQALAEKEVLLSEIHHRVKNNLTAFISLLALEGSYDNSPAGIAMKNDLQNRARSMALIHETLYKTHEFSRVDMDAYLTTLVDQIFNTILSNKSVKAVVDAKGISLDLNRATPAGLIVNELVTNAIKYAFPGDFNNSKGNPTITVQMTKDNNHYTLRVSDNGIGLPSDIDNSPINTLGLKLVSFLSSHQMRAKMTVNRENGTEFIFQFHEDITNKKIA